MHEDSMDEEEWRRQQRLKVMKEEWMLETDGCWRRIARRQAWLHPEEEQNHAEGSAGLLHKITKPTAWRGGAQILKKEEDVRLLDRCEAKRKERATHWQFDESVQNMKEMLRKMRK